MLILMYMAIILYALFSPNRRVIVFKHYNGGIHPHKSRFWLVCAAMLSFLSLTSKTYADVENDTVVFNMIA